MAEIRNIKNPWRDALMPASFRTAYFHVEAGSKESGRRIVVHEFPKRDVPYAEDMGRRAIEFTVRAYIIQYPRDEGGSELYRRDYRIARDRLIQELEREGDGSLQLPLLPPLSVVVQRYRVTETQKEGGYCVFDISFVEFGRQQQPQQSSRENVMQQSDALSDQTVSTMQRPTELSLPPAQMPGLGP